jgi:hypothetical protein
MMEANLWKFFGPAGIILKGPALKRCFGRFLTTDLSLPAEAFFGPAICSWWNC